MFIIVLGQHVSILIESSSGPSKKIDPYLEMLKCCVGTHILFLITFFENFSVYHLMWKNTVEPDRTKMTMAHAHCMLDT